jgi:hypothetical protein
MKQEPNWGLLMEKASGGKSHATVPSITGEPLVCCVYMCAFNYFLVTHPYLL